MARLGKNRRSKRNNQRRTVAILSVVGLVIAIAGLGFASFWSQPSRLDPATLCIEGQPPAAIVSILVDTTDTLPTRSQAKAKAVIAEAIEAAPSNTLITVFGISSEAEEHIRPLLTICRPDDGSEASELTASPGLMKQRFEEGFFIPINTVFDRLLSAESSDSSPIIEAIESASVEALLPHKNVVNKRLIVISDFLQHSNVISFYRQPPHYPSFEQEARTAGLFNFDLVGASVSLLFVPRDIPKGERPDLVQFWTDLLRSHGAGFGTTLEPL